MMARARSRRSSCRLQANATGAYEAWDQVPAELVQAIKAPAGAKLRSILVEISDPDATGTEDNPITEGVTLRFIYDDKDQLCRGRRCPLPIRLGALADPIARMGPAWSTAGRSRALARPDPAARASRPGWRSPSRTNLIVRRDMATHLPVIGGHAEGFGKTFRNDNWWRGPARHLPRVLDVRRLHDLGGAAGQPLLRRACTSRPFYSPVLFTTSEALAIPGSAPLSHAWFGVLPGVVARRDPGARRRS